ncbi:MAG: hypothetical protein WCO65_01460 [bacterium]
MFYLLILVLIIIVVIIIRNKNRFISQTPWQHFFDGAQFSTQEFYKNVEEGIKKRNIPGISFDRESFSETHILSTRREYLRITRGEYVFFVSMTPFGSGSFASYWMCVKPEGILNTIPFANKLIGKDRSDKTFYQMDSEQMYKSVIHTAVLDELDSITKAQGIRGLTESEKEIK